MSMKIKFEINTGFVKDGGRGAFWCHLELDDEDVKVWKEKRDAVEKDERLEMFIVQDIRELVQMEIAEGKYGLFDFNDWAVDFKSDWSDNVCIFSVRS